MEGRRLIDANALMEQVNNLCSDGSENWIGTDNISYISHADVADIISDAPTVDAVEVVHGRWEDRENPQWRAYDIRHCSICGWYIAKNNLRKKDLHWNYCPNCGAKMDGAERKDNE